MTSDHAHTLAHTLMLSLTSCLLAVAEQTWSSALPPDDTREDAKARFESDKKLCTEETSSEARLQCRRDAKSVYDKAMSAIAAPKATKYSTQSAKPVPTVAAPCADCGHVTAVSVADKAGDSNAVGLLAGGVAGAVLGHQVGGGFGKDLATIAGAAGGAYAGKKIQESAGATKVWTVSVKYSDGHSANFDFPQDPGFTVGDTVKNSGSTVIRY